VWLVDADGSNLHRLVSQISGYPTWSGDGKWLYYSTTLHGTFHAFKTAVAGGASVLVRNDNACVSALGPDGSTLYYSVPHLKGNGIRDYEIRAAHPERSPSVRLAHIAGERVPHWQVFQPSLSHGGKSPTSALVEPSSYAGWLGRQTTRIYSLQSAMAMPTSF
jgi:Tol biopolymer transport system component